MGQACRATVVRPTSERHKTLKGSTKVRAPAHLLPLPLQTREKRGWSGGEQTRAFPQLLDTYANSILAVALGQSNIAGLRGQRFIVAPVPRGWVWGWGEVGRRTAAKGLASERHLGTTGGQHAPGLGNNRVQIRGAVLTR